MKLYKLVSDGYILGISYDWGEPISQSEFKAIQDALDNCPKVESNQMARLRDSDLTWEIIEK